MNIINGLIHDADTHAIGGMPEYGLGIETYDTVIYLI